MNAIAINNLANAAAAIFTNSSNKNNENLSSRITHNGTLSEAQKLNSDGIINHNITKSNMNDDVSNGNDSDNLNSLNVVSNTQNNRNKNNNNSSNQSNCTDAMKPKQHNCPYCERSFTRPYRLNDHISFSHTDEKKYFCTLCSKNFSCKDKLKHHNDVKHDNKKPYSKSKTKTKNTEDLKCNFPGCSKAFANKYNVKRHIENVHLKMRRKSSKSFSSDINSSQEHNCQNSQKNNTTMISLTLNQNIATTSSNNNRKTIGTNSTNDVIVNQIQETSNNNNNNNNNNNVNTINMNSNMTSTANSSNNNINVCTNNNKSVPNQIQNSLSISTINYNTIANLPVLNKTNDIMNSVVKDEKNDEKNNLCNFHGKNQQLLDHQDDEKNLKIYTCARCPEMFNSSTLLRKHINDNHEKGFPMYNIW